MANQADSLDVLKIVALCGQFVGVGFGERLEVIEVGLLLWNGEENVE